MDYWDETMQDDCYLISADGWRDAAQPTLIVEDKTKKTKAKKDSMKKDTMSKDSMSKDTMKKTN